MTRNFDDENREPPQIVIQDLRHSRSGEEEVAEEEPAEQPEAVQPPEASTPAEPAAEPVSANRPDMEVVEAPTGAQDSPGQAMHGSQAGHDHHDHAHDHDHGEGADGQQIDEAAYQQVLQIFEMGLDNYQKSQLGIYIQFALIHLGRMPHPVTGLVATDTERARFAIDLLHVSFTHLEKELQPQEKQEFQSVLAQLQMTYAQIAGNVPRPPGGNEPEA